MIWRSPSLSALFRLCCCLLWSFNGGIGEAVAADSRELLTEGVPGLGWTFDNGREFPGAAGELVDVSDGPDAKPFLRLSADFSGGGSYVQMMRALPDTATGVIRMKVRSTHDVKLRVRLIDSTGQCHQGQPLKVESTGEWQEVEIDPARTAGGEHWGGADDGQWHDPPTKMAILLANPKNDDQPSVDIAEIQAEGPR